MKPMKLETLQELVLDAIPIICEGDKIYDRIQEGRATVNALFAEYRNSSATTLEKQPHVDGPFAMAQLARHWRGRAETAEAWIASMGEFILSKYPESATNLRELAERIWEIYLDAYKDQYAGALPVPYSVVDRVAALIEASSLVPQLDEFVLAQTPVAEWILERYENCLRISKLKQKAEDRESWLEDAWYFREVLKLLLRLEKIDAGPHTCDTPNYTDGPCQACALKKIEASSLKEKS